jgi:transposase
MRGRKPVPLADAVFAAAYKVYGTFSGRRSQTDLDAAHAAGFLSRPIRYNTVFDVFDKKELTPILEGLIVRSSLPLRAIETDFASDSTGFCTSRFVKWFDHKYGVVRQKYDWVKFHMMCAIKTNVVTAARIGERYSGDSPEFKPLLATTARNFEVREVSADSAYASYENFEAVGAAGGTPYFDFKGNTTAAGSGLFETMFHVYSLHRDDYLNKYHKRSNVESTASMVKAKFGDHLRSKTDTAMANEALCKILFHNICVLIICHYELGIAPIFWGEEVGAEEPASEDIAEPCGMSIEAWAWI